MVDNSDLDLQVVRQRPKINKSLQVYTSDRSDHNSRFCFLVDEALVEEWCCRPVRDACCVEGIEKGFTMRTLWVIYYMPQTVLLREKLT
jgi:hypothetical protein